MKIGLIDIDGHHFPNLALMKLSAWHKGQGDIVEWYTPWTSRYDRVYASKVFSFSEDYTQAINADEVIRGGSGYCIDLVDGREVYRKERDKALPSEVEHIFPDYSLYPQYSKDTAYGFLTRGCPRGCGFCVVGVKEGLRSVKVADLSEFWNGQKNIVLCDPNILACPDWGELLEQLARTRAKVDINQGLDIRMMTEEKAKALAEIRMTEVHFAWDRYQDKDTILPKFEMYRKHSTISSHNAIVYTLTNYDSTLEQDLERIYTLRDMGYSAFVTVYDMEHCDPIYRRLRRWCNNRFVFHSCPNFNDYKS